MKRTVLAILLLLSVAACRAETPEFDGAKSYSVLVKQCDFGPRPPGTDAHTKTRDYLYGKLKEYADSVYLQNFTHETSSGTLKLSNILARFGKPGKPAVLLCAHWDTRPTADRDLSKSNRNSPIIGANDGASGVAVLMELARMFKASPPPVPVVIVLFDGEDWGPTASDMYLGSKYFASGLNKESYKYGILLDMVGDADLNIFREGNSQIGAPEIVDRVWKTARELGYAETFNSPVRYNISDDHIPLIRAGVPCADVIDFDYPWWHTLKDTPDKCSAESLKIVGDVISRVVYSETP